MKHLSKLVINPEKVMKNEELIILKGGYDPCTGCIPFYCDVYEFENGPQIGSTIYPVNALNEEDAEWGTHWAILNFDCFIHCHE